MFKKVILGALFGGGCFALGCVVGEIAFGTKMIAIGKHVTGELVTGEKKIEGLSRVETSCLIASLTEEQWQKATSRHISKSMCPYTASFYSSMKKED